MNAHSLSEFTRTSNTYLTMPYFQKSQNNTHGLIEAHILIIFNENIFQNYSFAKLPDLFPMGWILIISSFAFSASVFVFLYRSG